MCWPPAFTSTGNRGMNRVASAFVDARQAGGARVPGARGRRRSTIPGFGLSLGLPVTYLSLIVLIPLSAMMIKAAGLGWRSEEHTSELQSLMRSSYAVFCLKKNNTQN